MGDIEIWKDIPQYEGLYRVSNLGNIKLLNYRSIGTEKILKPCLTKDGYLIVGLTKEKITKTKKVHQLVAIAFLNHTPCGMELVVNHKNFIKTDNRLENLEIVSSRENSNRKHLKSTSRFTGVYWYKRAKKWRAQIIFNGKNLYLGDFSCETEASLYYENAVLAIKNGDVIKTKNVVTTSNYKGVYWSKHKNRWIAQTTLGGKHKYIGSFKTEIEASEAYQNYYNNGTSTKPVLLS